MELTPGICLSSFHTENYAVITGFTEAQEGALVINRLHCIFFRVVNRLII